MHAPALGHLLAEIILDGRATTTIDTHALRPERFAEGDLNESARAALTRSTRRPSYSGGPGEFQR